MKGSSGSPSGNVSAGFATCTEEERGASTASRDGRDGTVSAPQKNMRLRSLMRAEETVISRFNSSSFIAFQVWKITEFFSIHVCVMAQALIPAAAHEGATGAKVRKPG
jgi:hypothetical protein